ncbi:hypothetical protein EIN_129290 [Entamoeba invadens IP1]|uniref:Uncharacterized protein n=1 Tax=Entamoeba invadens IP1 TaxID=370355 RepID=L7FN84_ENTIV|nr:hypothetical protein EIN_129290 [Entamoeba invadens IP1]ELP91589.1 hypothetical protein EIN_129290 [Entamoeba invadens IP1]|eukprot:XP_004258360.1 hypothetical protein EIN_129290 [Entamoeba invadens IP1]
MYPFMLGYDVLIYVVDVTLPTAFDSIESDLNRLNITRVENSYPKNLVKYLIGNKVDLCSEQTKIMNKTLATLYAETFGMRYVEMNSTQTSPAYLESIARDFYETAKSTVNY